MSDFAIGVLALGVAYLVGIVPFVAQVKSIRARNLEDPYIRRASLEDIKLNMYLWLLLPGIYPIALGICWIHEKLSEILLGHKEEEDEG